LARRVADSARRDLSPIQLLACAAILVAADLTYQHTGDSFVPGGPLDETAHLLTALLILQLVPQRWRAPIIVPALIASVAIDLDHVPQYLGYYFFTQGTPRPYTHSLLTIVVLLAAAALSRRHRRVAAGLAIGVVLHLFRDMAEGGGSGVALLWPVSDHAFSYPHATYQALMAGVVAADLGLALWRQSVRRREPQVDRGLVVEQR